MINLDNLAAGESAVYYTGQCIARSSVEAKYTAWEMYMRGEAELTTRKVKIDMETKEGRKYTMDGFDYICTKRREKVPAYILNYRQAHYENLAKGGVK